MPITPGDVREVPHNIHDLKCWPPFFEAFVAGEKLWDIRRLDRPFAAGDLICLREFDPTMHIYTGRLEFAQIVRIWPGFTFIGIMPTDLRRSDSTGTGSPIELNYCILSLRRVRLQYEG